MSRARLELLEPAEAEGLVGEACRLLEEVGVEVESAEGRELLRAAGAEERDRRLRLPERAVRAALDSVPQGFVLHDRAGAPVADLSGTRVHFDPGSAALNLLEYEPPAGGSGAQPRSGESPRGPSAGIHSRRSPARRPALARDLENLARLVDGLPHYACQSTALTAADVPEPLADRYRLHVALKHGRKPVVTGTFRQDGFAPMHAMLVAVRGSEAGLRARPLAVFDCCPTSPLRWSDLTTQALIDAARAGVPANLVAVPMAGATAPVTLRDALVQHCAENLSGVVMHQQAAPGAPVIYGGAPAVFDMRRGTAVMSAVESLMIDVGGAQLGRHLGLPTHAYMGLSDAKGPDYQAGMETAFGVALAALAGVNLVSGPGLLDYLLTQSLEKLLLDHEACGQALRLTRGLERREGGGLPLFAELARAGQLLGHAHTRRHWRAELGLASVLIDRESWGDWQAAGARDAAARAAEEVARRLALPAPEPLPEDVARELDAILAAEAVRHGVQLPPPAAG